MIERRIENRQIAAIFTLFLMAQIIGLFILVLGLPYAFQLENIATSPTSTISTIFALILDVIIAALILMLMLRMYKNGVMFKILEAYIVLLGAGTLFYLFAMSFFGGFISLTEGFVVAAVLSILLLLIKSKMKENPRVRNITTIFSSVGMGILIGVGIGNILLLYLLIAAFAVYDYVAVFVLKFMLPLAKQAVNMNLAFMLNSSDMEAVPKKEFTSKERKEFSEFLKKNKHYSEHVKEITKMGSIPSVSSIMLGNGDIMLPLAVAAGAYAATANIFVSVLIVVFSGFGVISTMIILRKYKVGLPAIPPLFSFISIAFALFFIIEQPNEVVYILIFIIAAILSMSALLFTLRRIIKKQKLLVR